MNRRAELLRHWVSGRKNDVGFLNLVQNVLGPTCSMKAKKYVNDIKIHDENLIEVYLKGFEPPLYFPKETPLRSLFQVITESFDEKDWHYYEIDETRVGKNDIVADCGAAEGLFSFLIANRCKKVYAIEPLPKFVNSLKKTFADLKNVEVMPYALSDKLGEGVS